MPRGLSKEAKAALLKGYHHTALLPPSSNFAQRLADYVFNETNERYSAFQCNNALTWIQRNDSSFQRRPRGSGRGLSQQAKEILRNGYEHRDQLDSSRGLGTALVEYIKENTSPPEVYDEKQVWNALFRQGTGIVEQIKGSAGESESEAGPSGAGGGSPFEVETRETGGTSPHVLYHQPIFSGPDHVVVPSDDVTYNAQKRQYFDAQGRVVTPHWLDTGYF
ncbi:hypothetical protein JCM8547_005214 [Rhodosporidiobolus lusitaniae]